MAYLKTRYYLGIYWIYLSREEIRDKRLSGLAEGTEGAQVQGQVPLFYTKNKAKV